jgi:hypothetical protein
MGFGEAALQQQGQRSADVRADSMVACRVLYTRDFEALERDRLALAIRLLHNLLRSTAETAVRLTADVAALEG